MHSRMLESGTTISFRLAEGQGAALVTKYQTHREDIQRAGTFEKYMKEHYTSWVAFASATGHGDNINPVLITGVDRTKDFAMMSYSDDDDDLRCEFTTSVPGAGSASAWGTWYTAGFVHTNCGPQLHFSPSAQAIDSTPSGNDTGTVSDEYDQCVFVRYYAMRKRLGIPRVIKAAAGPRDLGPGGHDSEGSSPKTRYDSDSDNMPSVFDDGGDDDRSSASSIDSGSDIIVHNTAAVRSLSRTPVRSNRPSIGREG